MLDLLLAQHALLAPELMAVPLDLDEFALEVADEFLVRVRVRSRVGVRVRQGVQAQA